MKLFDKDKGKELFGKVSGAISKTVDQVVEGVDNVAESAKLKMAVSKVKGRMEDKKTELGDLVYQFYKENQSDDTKIVALCQEIKAIEEELVRLETEGMQAKPQEEAIPKPLVCPKCENPFEEKDLFCPNCGNKLRDN